jgi:hypothetical protein
MTFTRSLGRIRRVVRDTLAFLVVALNAPAQVITTVAGTSFASPTQPLPATNAPLGMVQGIAVDQNGNVYIADSSNGIVEQITPLGQLTVVAGNGIEGFSGDGGPATSASMSPLSLALDSGGNLYILGNS